MHYRTLCPHCSQGQEIDDAEYEISACPHCGYDWICNSDAEPEGSLVFSGSLVPVALELASDSDLDPGYIAADEDWKKIVARPKPNRKQSSILQMILPPIFGAVAAVFISIAILWYGFGRDFANAGPTVAKYIPWIVPEELRRKSRGGYRPVDRADRVSTHRGRSGDLDGLAEPATVHRTLESEIQAEIQKIQFIARKIEELNEKVEKDPPTWSAELKDAYRKTLEITQPWQKILRLQKETPRTPAALAQLLNQPWYRTLIDEALRALPFPAESESIAWFADVIEWDLTDRTQQVVRIRPEFEPGLDRVLVWKVSDAVEQFQLRVRKGCINNSISLLLGTVETNDEDQVVIRIDAVIR